MVPPKVLRLLFLLVGQRHRAVADEELMMALWPNETVGRASIKRAVMGARTVLDNRGQSCIRTVRGHGYQFVMPAHDTAGLPAAVVTHAAAPNSVVLNDAVFVGREGVLAELDASLADALAGRGRCVLFVGEPGIGKSHTLHELERRATAFGAQVWLGRCMEFDGAPAFWPLLQILRAALSGRDRSTQRSLLGPGAPDIAEVFPELRHWLPDLPTAPVIGSVPARFRFFDSMALFLARAAEEQPLVLLLDDLQRADQPTLRLLVFLVRKLDTSRLLVVGSARPTDHRDGEVPTLLAELARETTTRSIQLHGLNRSELSRYLELRTGALPSASVVERLHALTAGNPLFLDELLRSARTTDELSVRLAGESGESGESNWEATLARGHHRGLNSAIERHLAMLSEPCRALLISAAVLGRDFSVGLLTQLVDMSADAVLANLSEAVTVGVVHALANAAGQHRFTHALIRDVLYQRMPAWTRAQQHARAGIALEARGAAWNDIQLAEVAEHFMHAAPTHDAGKALFYARRAAERATQRLAYEEAAAHLGRALQVLELGEPDAQQRMALLLARGEALALGAESACARATLMQAVTLARELGETDVIVKAATLLARPRESGTVDIAQVSLLREALATLPERDPRTPSMQALLAKSLSYSNEHAQREGLARSALALTRELADPGLRAGALQACHEALTAPESLDQRVFIADELTRLSHLHADSRFMFYAATARIQNCVEHGDMAGVDAAILTLEALAQLLRDPFLRWYALSSRSMRAMVAGKLRVSEEHAREAWQLGKLVGEDLAYHYYCVQVNAIMRLQGRIEEAEVMARDISLRHPALAGWRAVVATIDAQRGRTALAAETLAQLMDQDLTTLRRDPYLLSALCPVAELCVRVGDGRAAKVLYDALLPYEDHHGNVSFGSATYGPISLPLAWLATRMRELEAAQRHAQHAIAAAERMPSPTFAAMGCLSYAFALIKADTGGAREQASALLARAQSLADASGLWTIAEQCRALLPSLAR
ncbi:MAG: hypothetical protein RLZZ450_369 [Pseudomonadota bacterium]